MSSETVYLFHKNGAPNHSSGLAYLLSENGAKIEYREFSVLSKFYKGIVKGRPHQIKKQFTNAFFLLSLLFSSNKKVVVALAPFDKKIVNLLRFLKGHQVYYHTSWTYWDKSFHPKKKHNTAKVFHHWKVFLEHHCKHIFSVNQKGKEQLLASYDIDKEKVSVVHHALHPQFIEKNTKRKARTNNSFIYVGRLTPEKGLKEVLEFFTNHPLATFTIIGDGKQKALIEDYADKFENIHFKGYFSNKKGLIEAFASHEYLVLNSQRTERWEELFGLIIIEAMSQGCLPISSAHSGPKEILNESFGYLFEEGKIKGTLARIVQEQPFSAEMSRKAIENSKKYTTEHISKKWQAILN